MRYIHKILFLALLGTFLLSCKKDSKDFNYKDVNKLTVATSATSYVVEQQEVLNIKTTISESLSGGGPYTYEWIAYKPEDIPSYNLSATELGNQAIKISTEKDLNVPIKLAAGNYLLQYTITDTKTKVSTYNRYKLTVNGKYYEGWIVMGNKAGVAQLSFVRADDKVFMDPISTANNFQLKGKAVAAFSGVISMLEEVFVFTDQDIYRFNANGFAVSGKSSDLFNSTIPVKDPYYTVNSINTDQYIVSDGGAYGTLSPSFGGGNRYSDRFNGPDYYLFPYFMSGSRYYTIFYDNKGKRFLQNSYNTRALLPFPTIAPPVPPAPALAYDLNNVGKEAIAIDRGPDNEYYCVMKDNSGYFFYTLIPNLANPTGIKQSILNSPDISIANTFASSGTLKQMYYAANNKVYLYDVLANASRLVYQFPVGTIVKDIEMYKAKGSYLKTNDLYNRRLVVATYNGTEGEVYYLELSNTGDIVNNTYSKKFGGFGDIVQINYRNPNE